MEGLVFASFALLFFAPLISGYYASTRGRSFWFWCLITLCIPIIPMLVLMSLTDISEEGIAAREKKMNRQVQ